MKQRVLFVCIQNSARSQMAEAFLNHICAEYFEAWSAGLDPGTVNPLVVEAMQEAGIDISRKDTKSVFDLFHGGQRFAYVIAVCDSADAGRCPVFPGPTQHLLWSFPDPVAPASSREERLGRVRQIRDQIQAKVQQWCDEVCVPQR